MKYFLALVIAFAVFIGMTALKNITGWDLDFLTGWFTVTGLFAAIDIWEIYNEDKYSPTMTLANYLIAFGLTLMIVVIGKIFFMSQGWVNHGLVLGTIGSIFYNLVQIELIKKQITHKENK